MSAPPPPPPPPPAALAFPKPAAGGPGPPPPPPPPPPGGLGTDAAPNKRAGLTLEQRVRTVTWAPQRFQSSKPRADCGFAGLANQGATCYMNSLLQTLFMTPEFRAILYAWRYDAESDGPETSCIPLQLQKLFARLDLTTGEAVDTMPLTTSFGWFGNEAFEQQDVQELCRVLFEALDKSFLHRMLSAEPDDDAPPLQLVSELYEGIMTDYIACQSCTFVSERNDKFQDLQVPVRGSGSLVRGLGALVTPERLDGANQYFCSGCGAKVDALRGSHVRQLPYLLALQLRRFDFDYNTMARCKLHDPLTFPALLNMSPYLAGAARSSEPAGTAAAVADAETGASDNTYELFSILIHAGGAMGGHYYAYVRSFESGQWLCFNDNKVSPCTSEQLASVGLEDAADDSAALATAAQLSAGAPAAPDPFAPLAATAPAPATAQASSALPESVVPLSAADSALNAQAATASAGSVASTSKSAEFESSATAYMLMYRRVDLARNVAALPLSAVPASARPEIDAENAELAAHFAELTRKHNTLKLRVYYGDESPMLLIHNDEPLSAALTAAKRELGLDGLDDQQLRFRAYNPFTKLSGESYEDVLARSLKSLGFPAIKSLVLERRNEAGAFPEELDDAITVHTATVRDPSARAVVEEDYASNFFTPLAPLRFSKRTTVGELKHELAPLHGVPVESQRLVVVNLAQSTARVLALGDAALAYADAGVASGDIVYVEPRVADDDASVIVARFEYEKNLVEVCYNLPADPDNPPAQIVYDQVLIFDRRKTLRELKADGIARALGLPVDAFKLCRNLLSKEYKNEDETLVQAGLFHGSAVFVQMGAPMQPNEHKLRFSFYTDDTRFVTSADASVAALTAMAAAELDPMLAAAAAAAAEAEAAAMAAMSNPTGSASPAPTGSSAAGGASGGAAAAEPTDGKDARRFSPVVCELIAAESLTIDEVRAAFLAKLAVIVPSKQSVLAFRALALGGSLHARLRERVANRAGKVLLGSLTLREAVPLLKDRLEIAVHLVAVETKTADSQLVVRVQRWRPSLWAADGAQDELTVERDAAIGEFRAVLAARYAIPIERLRCAKPLLSTRTEELPDAALDLQWTVSDALVVGDSPWCLRDGTLVLFKDDSEPAVVPAAVLERRPRETGIRIVTRYDVPPGATGPAAAAAAAAAAADTAGQVAAIDAAVAKAQME